MAGVLRALASRHRSDPLGELAREVLAGRLSVRDAAVGNAYAEPLGAAMDHGIHHLSSLGPAERAALDEEVGRVAAALREAPEDTAPPTPSPARRVRDDDPDNDDWNGRSVMVPARPR